MLKSKQFCPADERTSSASPLKQPITNRKQGMGFEDFCAFLNFSQTLAMKTLYTIAFIGLTTFSFAQTSSTYEFVNNSETELVTELRVSCAESEFSGYTSTCSATNLNIHLINKVLTGELQAYRKDGQPIPQEDIAAKFDEQIDTFIQYDPETKKQITRVFRNTVAFEEISISHFWLALSESHVDGSWSVQGTRISVTKPVFDDLGEFLGAEPLFYVHVNEAFVADGVAEDYSFWSTTISSTITLGNKWYHRDLKMMNGASFIKNLQSALEEERFVINDAAG